MTWKLFLDDERDPLTSVMNHAWRSRMALPFISPDPLPFQLWVVARSYTDAVLEVEKRGWPVFVSFDHDLGHGPDGHAFAHWLVNRDLDKGDMPDDFAFEVHSGNPIGRINIEGLLTSYLAQRKPSGPEAF